MSILDRLNEADAPGWRPTKGDQVVGKIVDISQRTGEWSDEPYLIVTIKQENGECVAVHAFHYVLAQELRKYKLKYGTEIGIRYLGKPDGKSYENYKVAADAEYALDQPSQSEQPASQTDVPTDDADFRPQTVPSNQDDDIPF